MATTKSRRLSRALRWRRLTIPLAVMLLAAASHAEPALVHVEHENAAFHVQAAATLAADPKTVWRTLVDYDDLPSFIPDMTSSKTLRRAGETAVVEQRGRVGIGPFHRAFDVTLSVQEQPMNSVAAKALAGDFDRFESSYRIQETGDGGTRINYDAMIEPTLSIPSVLGTPVMEHVIRRQFEALLAEITRRSAAAAATPASAG